MILQISNVLRVTSKRVITIVKLSGLELLRSNLAQEKGLKKKILCKPAKRVYGVCKSVQGGKMKSFEDCKAHQ